jgi:hypothetical protein
MMTAGNRIMLVALVPAFLMSAVATGLWEGGRASWRLWRAMWAEAACEDWRDGYSVGFTEAGAILPGAHDQDRDVERQRRPRPGGAVARVDEPRAA